MRGVCILAISPKADEATIREYGLYVESGANLDDPRSLAVADRVVSGHAPITLPHSGGCRVHIASTQQDLRRTSLRAVCAYVEGAHRLFPYLRHINMHAAPHQFPDPPIRPGRHPVPPLRPDLARWDLLVDAVRTIARLCRSLGLTLSVENNWAYWDGIAPAADLSTYDPTRFVEYYCTSPEEWLRLAVDVNESNFSMCLDPSHATPYSHRWPALRRREALGEARLALLPVYSGPRRERVSRGRRGGVAQVGGRRPRDVASGVYFCGFPSTSAMNASFTSRPSFTRRRYFTKSITS